jgi:hypothetical protein
MPEQLHTPALHSANIQTKSNSYFFDVRVAKNGHQYLCITESHSKDGQRFRNSIMVFPEQLQAFNQIVTEMSSKVKSEKVAA